MNMEKYEKILTKFNYGGLELKNRIIFAPTTLGLSNKKYFNFIENLAKGDVAMIIIGDVPVSKSPFLPSFYTKRGYKFYKQIIEISHKYGCKVAAQLHESDTNMHRLMKVMPKLMSKKVTLEEKLALKNKVTSDYICSLKTEEVKHITNSFELATKMAIEIGFDCIQVHGDRMCGSFSSSIFNKREDEYGNSIQNRARFAIECVEAVRRASKTIPIDFKFVVRQENPHYGNAGVLFDEIKYFIPLLEKAGVTSFHVTLADHSKLEDAIPPINHPYFNKEGCFLKFVDEVKKYTSLPITGVGCLSNPNFIENLLESNRIDAVSMSRQLIADPNYVVKLEKHEEKNIVYCTRCNKGCFEGLMKHQGVHCIRNK